MNRLQSQSIALLTAATLLGPALVACGEDFSPYNRLTSPRVLAIASDPPAPMTGETTTISPILYLPEGVAVDSYEWSWCPFPGGASDGYPCLVTEEELEEYAGGEDLGVPPFDLGTAPTATFTNSIVPLLFQAICAGAPDAPPPVDCFDGFPAQLKLVMRAGDVEITTIRRLRLRFDPAQETNAIPVIAGLDALLPDSEAPIDGTEPSVTIPRAEDTVIRARVDTASAEEFTDRDEDGQPITAFERLNLSWFVESGDTRSGRTSFIDGLVTFDRALENEWEPARVEDYPGDTSRIIVVVRDNRDGVTFAEGAVFLGGVQ